MSEFHFLVSVAAVGSAPFPYQYHAPTGYDFFPGQNQIAGPWQTGTGQPRGLSGSVGVICDALCLCSIHLLFGLVLPP